MDANIARTSVGDAGQLTWISPQLWSDTPHGAVHRAVEAQSQSVWRQLWQQALVDSEQRPRPPCTVTDSLVQDAGATGAEGTITVAAFVLSVPFTESLYTEKAEVVGCRSEVSIRRYVCVSLGSGSRCLAAHDTPASDPGEKVRRLLELRDGHAEVMARRGFIAFLIEMADASTRGSEGACANPFLQRRHGGCDRATALGESNPPQWELRDTVAVHLVCTRWMCGSLAAVAGGSGRSGHLLLRAACGCWLDSSVQSKVAAQEVECTSSTVVTHIASHAVAPHYSSLNEAASLLHAARVKPGKGRPNLSMSCTDKVWRWSVLGVQGRRRASLFPVPIRLASIHILHPPFADASCLQTAVDHATATFHWRSRRWSREGRDGALPPTPKLSFFSSAELVTAGQLAGLRLHDAGVSNDSSYSRSRWLCARCGRASRKRSRHDEAPALGNFVCTWQCCASTDRHTCSLVLNTKAGLPQGMTARALLRRCSATLEIPWQQCPLSRPWMAQRVQHLQASCNETALLFPSLTESPASTLCVPAAINERLSYALTADTECLCMSQRVHYHHRQPLGSGKDSSRLLWASSSHLDSAELLIGANANCESAP
ncbi:hypothetical protein JKF63_02038 [Porcisia hertigi]|uniref:tRNA-specific adenosine deaminase 1 n=1 Tax=Porcisia hertigi TaxID=2761500 RepID=A0A836HKT8_9TRYP|nr:hypothetical protein JKF63_02038 [Porcisia hertigi]